ncbi:TPM domain-containing protein [Piscinibacter sp.]|jgi:uncharacterized protein|uniref:TPM domain-containing protein n=1 Tax=Piscinibacter sp. TaxID=1903157 RepID=UPI0035596096
MHRWLSRIVGALGVAAALLAGSAFAQDVLPVPPLSGRVIDQTGTLTDAQRAALTNKLAGVESATGSQLVVLLVTTTMPEDIASYAQRVADQWKVGRRDVGDGLVIVVAKGDRKVRIEVAKTLEGAIPDLAAKRVISEQITPAFKAGDFAGGLNAAIDQLAARIKGEALPVPTRAAKRGARPGLQWDELAMFFFVGVPILGVLLTGMLGRKFGALATSGAAGALGWWLTASGLLAGGAALLALVLVGVLGIGAARRGHGGPVIWGGGGGGGGWGGGGGDAGGFSSGGGGDFGGGGASGDW